MLNFPIIFNSIVHYVIALIKVKLFPEKHHRGDCLKCNKKIFFSTEQFVSADIPAIWCHRLDCLKSIICPKCCRKTNDEDLDQYFEIHNKEYHFPIDIV